jgi:hypothetical protein
MKRPFVTVAVVVLALASSGLLVGSAAAKNRSCGTFRAKGTKFAATVLRGPVSCRTTRTVLSAFLSGKGKFHGPPNGPAYLQT